ncbi:MAG: Flp family type IVb pilin [Luteitalea sp.]|nr:Flp family type IVb pilin [Luteitalea sp.]
MARILREEDGQDLIEYTLVAALISIASVLAIGSVGNALDQRYDTMATDITGS